MAPPLAGIGSGGNPSSVTGSIPPEHRTDDQPLNLDDYQPLYHAALRGDWEKAKGFLVQNPDALKARVTNLSMTALHVAACEGHSEFVEKLVERMPAVELAALDDMGFTALHYAAIGGSLRSAKALVEANPILIQTLDSKGRTPLLLAATFASESKESVWYFLLKTRDEEPGHAFTGPWAANLMNMLIASGFHEISLYLLEQYPRLAIAKDENDQNCTPLFVLAKNPSNFLSGSRLGFWESCIYSFLPVELDYRPPRSMRAYVRGHESVQNLPEMPTSAQNRAPACLTRLQDAKLRHHCAVELVKRIRIQLSEMNLSWCRNYLLNFEIINTATVNGTTEIIRTLLEFFPDLIWVFESNNQYLLLRSAIELRHENLFCILCGKTARNKLMASTVLESGGTILHLAAKLAPLPKLSSISGAALQMQRELQWFKVVEELVHPFLKESANKSGETARELFTKEHKELAERGEKWLKDTSNSCMLVATLIATVMFAAAFTVPGGTDNDGAPNFLHKHSLIFMVFVVSDAISLFASLTSLLMFLSILTARYSEEDFLESLPKRLIIGLASLFFAIAAMMVAFGATLVLVLNKKFYWIYIPIIILATFQVTLFALLQLPLFIKMIRSTFGKNVFRPRNIW